MGLKDHLEDGTGHILSLELDLDYLHVESTERQGLGLSSGSGSTDILQGRGGACSIGTGSIVSRGGCFSANSSCSSSSSSSFSNLSEESAVSDSDDERLQNGPGSKSRADQPRAHPAESFTDLQQVRLDLTLDQNARSQKPPEAPALVDPLVEYRTKVEFALKLGYSEELVLMVLRKLGANALINDILGELVKLGTKTEMEQQECLSAPNCPSASSLSPPLSSLDPCQLLCPSQLLDKENLRPVVVDGSNVAMSHGNKEVFSCQGIQLAVDWFLDRGHRDITVFVPAWRKEQSRPDAPITDQEILRRLEKEKILVFTPSRRVQGRRVVCYDDRFIVKLAYESDGIIVSNDNYRDLANEKPEWKKFVDERLLMYSFVNDKFMPPDDPLGRHGPSLDNFLRKKPVIHRKQPCPYGKKCTYGHKCKFYHPERGTQPQRSVADELRASAKISSASSKGLVEDALMPKSQGSGVAEVEPSQRTPKKQSSTILRSSFPDLAEDRFQVARRGSSSSSSSSSSNHQGHVAPGGPPASAGFDPWEHPVESGGGGYRVAGTSGPAKTYKYHRCKSPDVGYNSLTKAYSSLSLEVPQSPDRFFPADLRASSLPSDCSSDGSISSDSFSPDLLADDGPRCHHHHHHHQHQHHHPSYPHLHHHHCSGQHTHPPGRVPPGLGQPASYGSPISQVLQRKFDIGLEEPSSSTPSHGTPHPFRSPSSYSPPHRQDLPPSGFSRDFHAYLPQMPTTPSPNHNLIRSRWQDSTLPDSRIYEGSPIFSRRNFSAETEQPLPTITWDPQYHRSPKPYSDPFAFQSRVHPSLHGHLARNPPTPSSFPQLSFNPVTPSKSPLPFVAPQHQEPQTLDRYQDLRERMFVNLCCIFPPDLVRSVMAKNLHVMDAQELAAAILMEKSKLES